MGADIHYYTETETETGWKLDQICYWDEEYDGSYELMSVSNEEIYIGRDYQLFGLLAGVRTEHPNQFDVKGFPDDASELLEMLYMYWDSDAHSASYLDYDELKDKLKEFKNIKPYSPEEKIKEIVSNMNKDQRLVFWFDN